MNQNNSVLSDAAGYFVWAIIFAGYTAPVWLPVVAFIIGAMFGISIR